MAAMAHDSTPETTAPKSVTLRRRLIAEVEELAGPRGFSSVTDQALSQWVAREKLRRAIADYERRAGVISTEEMAAIEAEIGGL
jgi:hypothetical protein